MLKALLKKQLLELNTFYFTDKKTGKRRSKSGTILFILLFAVLLLFLAGTFFVMSLGLALSFVPEGLTWLYFALVSILSLFLGVFGGVFNTYAGLYHAKDNEMLLSMPIPPSKILFARMLGVWLMGTMYSALVSVPAFIAYLITGPVSVLSVVFAFLLIIVLTFLVLTLTCALGWVVALISSKLKNKSYITAILALAFFVVYYYICFHFGNFVSGLIDNSAAVAESIRHGVYPLYLLGQASAGDPLSMLIFTAGAAALFGLTYFILSKTFIKITTHKESGKAAVYRGDKQIKTASVPKTLFKKEGKRLLSSATYMLNCALATLFMPVLGVLALVFSPRISVFLDTMTEAGLPATLTTVIVGVAVFFLVSMNDLTAPSVSLEGKDIWILQSMPLDVRLVLRAKVKLHMVMTLPAALFMAICLSIAFKIGVVSAIAICFAVTLYTWLMALLGLAINLKKPNMTWTNESVPVKQSTGVAICLFGGWAVSIALAGVGIVFALILKIVWLYWFLACLPLGAAVFLLRRWLMGRGAEIFSTL